MWWNPMAWSPLDVRPQERNRHGWHEHSQVCLLVRTQVFLVLSLNIPCHFIARKREVRLFLSKSLFCRLIMISRCKRDNRLSYTKRPSLKSSTVSHRASNASRSFWRISTSASQKLIFSTTWKGSLL
ncbi:hypothetical protein BJX66DRAFT_320236 [Aspergillus keveii]|uniref:Uncharacterized protein n=1 Tax=Aspergillus keveii TaxID=714993 RepID=A0ABR4FHA8_9EURO